MKNQKTLSKSIPNITITFLKKQKIPVVAVEVSCFSARNSARNSAQNSAQNSAHVLEDFSSTIFKVSL